MCRTRKSAIAAIAVACALLVTACTGSSGTAPSKPAKPRAGQGSASASSSAAAPAAAVQITPANGSKNVNPSTGVTVSAQHGTVSKVAVRASDGTSVTGSTSANGTAWHTAWPLGVSQTYAVTATVTAADGHQVTSTSTFRTLTPGQTFITQIFEGYNQTYGVGMPIILNFSQPITDKAAVERSLELVTSKPVVGAWYWDGDQALYFRPRDYWPANTTVSFTGHLNGVEAAPGVYGAQDLTQTFDIGRSLIAVASTTSHYTKIYLDGKLAYNWAISTGRPSLPTPDGTYLTVEKGNPVRMVGHTEDFYNELVYDAVRFTYSGDYFHSAPWSVPQQGLINVSHGCVNLAPGHAATYYAMAVPGDPITITNSTAAGKWDDGWTPWFYTWSQFLGGSALHEAVQAGPNGSTFVDPATLPPDTATSPTGTSAPGNFRAGATA